MMSQKKQGFQPRSSRLGGLKAQRMNRGWPDHIKGVDAREEHFQKVMAGRVFDEVRFKQPLTSVISWKTLHKLKRT